MFFYRDILNSNIDPYFGNVSFLLKGTGTALTKPTILDESSNSLSIMISGDTYLSSTIKKYGSYSINFDGIGDWLTTSNTSLFDFSSASTDFTIEGWIYPTNTSDYRGIIGARQNGAAHGWCLYIEPSSKTLYMGSIIVGQSYLDRQLNTTPIQLNTWTHFALVKNSSGYTTYINGVSGSLIALGNGLDYQSAQNLIVGAVGSQGEFPFYGNIDDLRITKGVARYTSNFTPPIAELPASSPEDPHFASVSLLLRGAGTVLEPGTIIDDSGNNTISVLGDAALSPVIKKFGDYSIKFDGSGDRLQIPDNARFDLSSGAFTIEAWFYCNAIDGNYQTLVSKDTQGSNFSWCIQVNSTSVLTATNNIQGDWNFTSNVTIIAKTWHHVLLVGDGTNMYHYFNGVLIGTKNRTLTNASANITVGCTGWNSPTQFFNGYIDDLRITKGGNTSLLLSGTGTRIEKTILDSSGNNHPISISGDSFLSSVVKKYGDYSISFDGSGDRLTIYDDPTFNLSGVPFTVEMWFYCNSINSNYQALVTKHTFGVNLSWNITINNASITTNSNNNGPSPILVSNASITAGTWHHIALVGNGTNIKHYFNGVEVGSVNGILSNAASLITIGANSWNSPSAFFNGYIDDLRITKGVARYTSNFTPPTAELPSNSFI